jgi:hypothetical protein
MPRQPFLPAYLKADLIYGLGHIKGKPKIAEAVGRCIMSWSYIDWQMAMLLAAMMKANSEASIAIFLTLKNARAQREVLVAAADMTLTGSNREIFDAIMLLYGGLQAQRADIAHGIFGFVSGDEDDVMPWIQTKNLSKDWIERFHKPKPLDAPEELDDRLAQKQSSSIYKLSDLEHLETEIIQLWGITFSFTSFLNYPESSVGVKTLATQLTWPQMVQALSQIRARRND